MRDSYRAYALVGVQPILRVVKFPDEGGRSVSLLSEGASGLLKVIVSLGDASLVTRFFFLITGFEIFYLEVLSSELASKVIVGLGSTRPITRFFLLITGFEIFFLAVSSPNLASDSSSVVT